MSQSVNIWSVGEGFTIYIIFMKFVGRGGGGGWANLISVLILWTIDFGNSEDLCELLERERERERGVHVTAAIILNNIISLNSF